jgi:hypothetical protein
MKTINKLFGYGLVLNSFSMLGIMFLPLISIILGIILLTKDRVGKGIFVIVYSMASWCIAMFISWGAYNRIFSYIVCLFIAGLHVFISLLILAGNSEKETDSANALVDSINALANFGNETGEQK